MRPDDEALPILQAEFGDAVSGPHSRPDGADGSDGWLEVDHEQLPKIARLLRDRLRYDFLNDLTVVDYVSTEKRLAAAVGEERVEVVYQLSSLPRGVRLTLKVTLPRWRDGVAGDPPQVPSLADVWAKALWHEREAYDLCGVRFVGHPDLRRILCPDDWDGHPLRKDYQMPLEYHGIRGR